VFLLSAAAGSEVFKRIADQYGLENIGKWVEEIGTILQVKLKCEPDLCDSLKQRYRNYKRSFKNKKGGRTQELFRKQLWTVPIKDHHFEVQALREDLERANARIRELSQSTRKCSYILFLYHNNNI
jgi:hypothetical protein